MADFTFLLRSRELAGSKGRAKAFFTIIDIEFCALSGGALYPPPGRIIWRGHLHQGGYFIPLSDTVLTAIPLDLSVTTAAVALSVPTKRRCVTRMKSFA